MTFIHISNSLCISACIVRSSYFMGTALVSPWLQRNKIVRAITSSGPSCADGLYLGSSRKIQEWLFNVSSIWRFQKLINFP